MKSFNYTLFFILLLSFTSCQIARLDKPEGKPATEENAIIGTYYLNREAWTGIPLAYHSEGVVNYDLLKEFRHMVGYCEPNHIAVVEKAVVNKYYIYGKSDYRVNVKIPYPLLTISDGKYCMNGVSYLNVTFRYNTNKEVEKYEVNSLYCASKNDFIVMNIKRAYVTELDENGLRITVISETYDAVNNLSKENFLDLYYEKKS